jgi:NAD(P)H-hydrate epimerase
MKLVSVAEMTSIEKQADAAGVTIPQLMENAGRGLAEAVQELEPEIRERSVLGLVGPGNNGGDTLVALAYLAAQGWRAEAYLVRREPDALVDRLKKSGATISFAQADAGYAILNSRLRTVEVILDGVLGTGTHPPLKGEAAAVLSKVNDTLADVEEPPYVIAVDCPSGVDCDTGAAAAECIPADLTVTMAAVKDGLLKMPAYGLTGELRVVDIGLPPDLPALQSIQTEVAERDSIASVLPSRSAESHKGTFGTALIAAGSVNYTGAALLAGQAAYRVGAGLVTLAVPGPLHAALAGSLPEATWILLPSELGAIARGAEQVLLEGFDRVTAVLVGPGFGMEDTTADFVAALLSASPRAARSSARMGFLGAREASESARIQQWPPCVFDADGLKLLTRVDDWPKRLPALSILTPHPGEMAVLTGLTTEAIQKDRRGIAARYAREWGHILVLKGAFTIVAGPDGRTTVIPVATAALARAGTGDVLAGLIVGLRAQGVEAYHAAVAGAWIHAEAGLRAAEDLGTTASVLASDVVNAVPKVMAELGRFS